MSITEIKKAIEEFSANQHSHECPYFSGRQSRMNYFYCGEKLPAEAVDCILEMGFRRSGELFYRNTCESCLMCECCRVGLDFRFNRSQRRNLKLNSDVETRVSFDPQPDAQRERVYVDYYRARHDSYNIGKSGNKNDADILGIMHSQMYTNSGNTLELSFYVNGELAAFSICDYGRISISAVYTVFDPRFSSRALGVFAVLKMFDFIREHDMKWIYLGFYIKGHPKMDYKGNYSPMQILDETGAWINHG